MDRDGFRDRSDIESSADDRFDTDDDELVPVAAGASGPAGSGSAGSPGAPGDISGRAYTLLSPDEVTRRRPRRRPAARNESPWARPPVVAGTPPDPDEAEGRGRPWRTRALVVVAVTAVGVTGFLAGRATQSAVPSPPAAPTPRWHDGVPGGFAPDAAGAQEAAAAFTTLFSDAFLADAGRFRSALAAIGSPGTDFATAAEQASATFVQHRTSLGLAPDGSVRVRTFPLTVALTGMSGDRAEVEVWAASVLAVDGVSAPSAGFATYRFDLLWTAGDWRLEDVAVHPAGTDAALPRELDFPAVSGVPIGGGTS